MTEKTAGELEKRINDLMWQSAIDEKWDFEDFVKVFEEMWSEIPKKDSYIRLTTPEDRLPSGHNEQILDFGKYEDDVLEWKRKWSGKR